MEKKIIKQGRIDLHAIEFKTDENGCVIMSQNDEEILVYDTCLKEVALAICPELQLELEKAKELLKEARDLFKEEAAISMRNGANRDVVDSYDDKAYKFTTFLEGSGNKTK